jgi:hypothetical protein
MKKTTQPKNVGGRPSVYCKEIVEKLEAAFRDGAHIYEACDLAGIDKGTYYSWLEVKDGFSAKMIAAQEWVTEIAKSVVARDITKKKNIDTAKWWLERKLKKEFSTRSELTGADGQELKITVEEV